MKVLGNGCDNSAYSCRILAAHIKYSTHIGVRNYLVSPTGLASIYSTNVRRIDPRFAASSSDFSRIIAGVLLSLMPVLPST